MIYTEKVDVHAVRWLLTQLSNKFLKSCCLDGEEERFNFTYVKRILNNYDKNEGVNKVKYEKKDKFGILRDYTEGVQTLPTVFRGLICKNMTDVDMKNAHPTIIYNLCKKYNVPCCYLEEYVNNRNKLLDQKLCTKMDIIRSINKRQNLKCDGWLKMFDNEMKQIQKKFYNMDKFDKQKELSEIKPKNREGSFMSHLATTYEAQILATVLKNISVEVAVLMFDGFMFYGDKPDGFLLHLSKLVKDNMDMDIEWCYKDHDATLSIPDDWVDDDPDKRYNDLKKMYENDLNLGFIEKNVTYCLKLSNNELCFYNQNELQQHLANVHIDKPQKKTFLSTWLKDPNRKTYMDTGVYPHDAKCPEGILNLWKGYAVESLNPSDADISLFIKHIEIICKEKNVSNFFLDWLANMFQYPSQKSIMFVLQGEEGSGKSVICDFVNMIIGDDCGIEINDVKERLFCRFNDHLSKKIFVNINETSRSEMVPFTEKLKALITSKDISIEPKGGKIRHEQQLMHFMTTVNPDNTFKITEGSRRFAYVEGSNELIGDTEYFDELFDFIYRKENQRAFYQFLMARKVKRVITLKDIPITEDMKTQFVLNREPIEDYCDQFMGEKTADKNYDDYKAFLLDSGLKYEVPKKLFEMRFGKLIQKFNIKKDRTFIEGVRSTVYSK